ncbi:MAG: phosphocholine cytidylyltransferase family protein [Desulfoprunum sp.]|jgi:choline kinase|uniref:phosphocholine cytidylyltransferase family protein n=1 Tax=Desulfoprunum sp. TaxID=2020866 RepID=UPI00068E8427
MKVIILSAGQGKRLLPMTATLPKCLLTVRGKTIVEWQIDELHKCGIEDITVVVGYNADKVENLLQRRYGSNKIRTCRNPDYATTDNLISCWMVREEMTEDFILLNGDTLFEAPIVESLLNSPAAPITVTINLKDAYDTDDMKVSLEGNRLVHVGKDIPQDKIHGESIGMILFRGSGPMLFRNGLEKAREDQSCSRRWFLSVIDEIAGQGTVSTCSIKGLAWCEIDFPADLQQAERIVAAHFHRQEEMEALPVS